MTALLRKTRPKSSVSGKTSSWKEHPGRIHKVERWNAVLKRDVLRAQHLLRRHGEKRASLHSGIVRDDHAEPATHAAEAGDNSRSRRTAVLFIHLERRPQAQLKEFASFIEQQFQALPHGEALFCVLGGGRLCASSVPNGLFLGSYAGKHFEQRGPVRFRAGRLWIKGGIDHILKFRAFRHSSPTQTRRL
jgi:hypothetical protein